MRARLRAWLAETRAYLTERPVRLAVVTVALVLGVGVGVPAADNAYEYTWRAPEFCGDCHVHDYADEAYFRSVHAGVTTCHDCHVVPLSHYPRNLWMMVTDRPQVADDIHTPHVASVLCEACHTDSDFHLTGPMTEELRARVVKIDESPLHRIHLDSPVRAPTAFLGGADADDTPREGFLEERVITCMDCHGSPGNEEAHRFTASRDNCLTCHEGIDLHGGRLDDLLCQECHFQGFVGASP